MNKRMLRGIMMIHGETGKDLADLLHMAPQTFSAKMNEYNGAEFTQGEIYIIKEHYSLTPSQIDEIFFQQKVS